MTDEARAPEAPEADHRDGDDARSGRGERSLGRTIGIALAGLALPAIGLLMLARSCSRSAVGGEIAVLTRDALAPLGIEVLPHDAPRQLAQRVRERLGERSDLLAYELEALERARYGRDALRRPDAAWWQRFAFEAHRLKRTA